MKRECVTIRVEPEFLQEVADVAGEVVMVLPRPSGKVLTMSKSFYPEGIFRLPSGKIRPEETPEEAFIREVREETSLDVIPVAKLAEIVLHCVSGDEQADVTSHILLGTLTTDLPHPQDIGEQISDYREADAAELQAIAKRLRSLSGKWTGWGHFRAPAHEVVAKYLIEQTGWNG